MKIKDPHTDINCEICVLGKMTQTISRKPDETAKFPFDVVNIDLAGPIEPMAEGDFKFALICTDNYSNFTFTYLLKQKSDAGKAFKLYLADIAPYGKIKCVRSNQEGNLHPMNLNLISRITK